MVDKKISELEDAGAGASEDIVPIVQNSTSTTKKLSIGAIVALVVATIATAATIATLTTSTIKPASDGVNAIRITKANGTTPIMSFNTTLGNVGIGTTGPGSKLDIIGTAGAGSDATYSGTLKITDYGINGPGAIGGIDLKYSNSGSGYGFKLYTHASNDYLGIAARNNSATWTERMVITNNGNVGIGTTSPGQKLEINGGLRLNTATAKPTCDATTRGTFWFVKGAAGVKDDVQVCAKDAGDAYDWRVLY